MPWKYGERNVCPEAKLPSPSVSSECGFPGLGLTYGTLFHFSLAWSRAENESKAFLYMSVVVSRAAMLLGSKQLFWPESFHWERVFFILHAYGCTNLAGGTRRRP